MRQQRGPGLRPERLASHTDTLYLYGMDRALRDALLAYSPFVADTRSWYSYRIRLASKLRAAVSTCGAPAYRDMVIQALWRWKTPASLLIYARCDTDTCAAILQRVQHADIIPVQYANLPETSEGARRALLAGTAEHELPTHLSEASLPSARTARLRLPSPRLSLATVLLLISLSLSLSPASMRMRHSILFETHGP